MVKPVSRGREGANRRAFCVTVTHTVEVATSPRIVRVVTTSDVEVLKYVDVMVVYTVDQTVRVWNLVLVR